MTVKEHRERLTKGTRLRCIDHWISERIGVEASIERAGITVQDWRIDGKAFRSEVPKASELTRCDASGWRVETTKPNGTPMYWEWEVIATD